jgi:hypothetical protein
MNIDLKLDKAGDAETVSVTGDIDMSPWTKMRDALPPFFKTITKITTPISTGAYWLFVKFFLIKKLSH